MRSGAVALALLALMSVLLQPVCGAYEIRPAAPNSTAVALADNTAQGTSDCAPCCPKAETSALLAPSSAAVAKAILAAEAAGPLQYAAAPRSELSWHAQPASSSPPPISLPYHVRSARILR